MKPLWMLLLLSVGLAPGASERTEALTRALVQQWSADGLRFQTGIDNEGTQHLAVLARAGYFPLKLTAKPGLKTVLHVYTNRTNDCSRVFTLPELNQQVVLPAKGVKDFVLPPMKKGSLLFGTCGMGMYTFEIAFTE